MTEAYPCIYREVENIIRQKNEKLARYETIKNFIILDHDFTIESGDLTPTLKVKRRKIFEKYGHLIEDLYKQA